MVMNELLNMVKDYVGIYTDDFDVELRLHIDSILARLEVNNIVYSNVENEAHKRLINSLIRIETFIKFDKTLTSSVLKIFEQEKSELWYLVLLPIYD